MNCCVPLCESSRKGITRPYDPVVHEINFHNFPKEESLREKWIEAILNGGSKTASTWRPFSRYPYICSLHFKPEDFTSCTTHKYLVPGCVPSIFPQNPQFSGQKQICTKSISSIVTPKEISPLKTLNKKKHKLKQRNVKDESKKVAGVKKIKTCNTMESNENSGILLCDITDNDSTQIDAVNADTLIVNNEEKNATSSEAINQSNSENAISVESSNPIHHPAVNKISPTNALGNSNLSYLGQFAVNNSSKKVKNFKIYQCTIKPSETNNSNMDQGTNYVDVYHPYAKPIAKASSAKIAGKQSTSNAQTSAEISLPEIITRVFSSSENCNLLMSNNPSSAVDSTTVNYDKNSNNENSKSIANPTDQDSNFSKNFENDSTLSAEERKKDISYWRAVKLTQLTKFRQSNKLLKSEILKLKESIEKHRSKVKNKNEMLRQFNIEALEKGVEKKDPKSLFISDQLRSLTRKHILWSVNTLEFMRRLVKKFPETYYFLKQADILNLPSPKILGCRKRKKNVNITIDSDSE